MYTVNECEMWISAHAVSFFLFLLLLYIKCSWSYCSSASGVRVCISGKLLLHRNAKKKSKESSNSLIFFVFEAKKHSAHLDCSVEQHQQQQKLKRREPEHSKSVNYIIRVNLIHITNIQFHIFRVDRYACA